ncbi:MAG: type VI secretion system baseplate subunit TssF [Fibrobacterota bacterium]|nr:type VI secretion system baseplate subunit TssF [Fibrobacterota bacterium]QQS05906.1 MAG: type VI secretion system baseplate subunit TssF [Fibrobacterota bacterium]
MNDNDATRPSIHARFVQETRALLEEGREFSVEYPEAARLLDPEKVEDRDPYVERLIDGFTFLTARSREAALAEEDGLTGHLLELLMGPLEQPLPAVTVTQFDPFRMREGETVIERGTTLFPMDKTTSDCRFSTSETLCLNHLSISDARIETGDQGSAQLELRLAWKSSRTPELWPDRIRIFLHGDAPVVWSLRYGLTRRQARMDVRTSSGGWIPSNQVRFERHDAPGYGEDSSGVSPLADARDFLCCDERFRFVELCGLGSFPVGENPEMTIRLRFEGSFPRGMSRAVSVDNFRLHCVVSVNRYPESCQTLAWEHDRSEKILRPLGPPTREVLDVVGVDGLTQSYPVKNIRYRRFSAYRHAQSGQRYFQIHRRSDVNGKPLVALTVGHPDPSHPFEAEYISPEALCCDGNRPNEAVPPFAPLMGRPAFPDRAQAFTLTRPSPIHRPGPRVGPLTKLLAFASGHFQGLLDARRMRDALHQFLWDPAEAKRPVVDSLQQISHSTEHSTHLGVSRPVLHVLIRLRDTTCAPDTWDRLGLLDVFASILHRIARDQTPIGSSCRTTVVVEPSGATLEHLD